MRILVVTRPNGSQRYYADGKRISRALLVAIKGDHKLYGFETKRNDGYKREWFRARKRKST